MKTLKSIASIYKSDIIDTGSLPIKVLCNDFTTYVVKYSKEGGPAYRLFKEYLASCFLEIWGLAIPDFAIVKVEKDHVLDLGFPYHYFEKSCFGSQYNRSLKEIDKFFGNAGYSQRKTIDHNVFALIALFDIWVSNEDRSHNNFNLLYETTKGSTIVVPIDHESIFNTGDLTRGLHEITLEDSVLYSDLTNLFKSNELTDQDFIRKLEEKFYLCVDNCKSKLPIIMSQIPSDWLIDTEVIDQKLNNYLFNEVWLKGTFQAFLRFLQCKL